MNDDELITAVRESVTDVHMNIPTEQIVSRSRAIRARRRVPVLIATPGVAAATVLAVTALLPASHPASHQPGVQLAAWTVAKQANGDIKVTIRQLSDPSGLQSTLRADGVPANVTSLAQHDPSCRPYPMTQALFKSIYQAQNVAGSGTILIIRPSALPSGPGVQIEAATGQQVGDRSPHQAVGNQTIHRSVHQAAARAHNVAIRVGLVYASQQCTGS